MTKKHLAFIIILTIADMLIWIVGEILIIAVFKLGGRASIIWTIIMVILTFLISLWKGLRDESSKNSRKW